MKPYDVNFLQYQYYVKMMMQCRRRTHKDSERRGKGHPVKGQTLYRQPQQRHLGLA